MTKFVRRLDDNNDPIYGQGPESFLYGAASVPQRLKTRLRLLLGEWFLDTTAGVPWWTPEGSDNKPIMGGRPDLAYTEAILKTRILETDGVASLDSFSLRFESSTRKLFVTFTVTAVDDGTSLTLTQADILPPTSVPVPIGSYTMGALFTVASAAQLRTLPNMSSYVSGQALAHADDVDGDYWLKDNTGNPDNLDPPGDGKYVTASDGRQWVRT